MPEGPSIVILKEAVQEFKGKGILSAQFKKKILEARKSNKL